MTSFEKLLELVEAIREDNEKFFSKDNNSAGTRLRKGLQEIKKQANLIRTEVTEKKKA